MRFKKTIIKSALICLVCFLSAWVSSLPMLLEVEIVGLQEGRLVLRPAPSWPWNDALELGFVSVRQDPPDPRHASIVISSEIVDASQIRVDRAAAEIFRWGGGPPYGGSTAHFDVPWEWNLSGKDRYLVVQSPSVAELESGTVKLRSATYYHSDSRGYPSLWFVALVLGALLSGLVFVVACFLSFILSLLRPSDP